MNWKIRFKNPVFVTSFVAFCVSTVYQALAMFDIAPTVTESEIMQIVAAVVQVLTLVGVLTDPTTPKVADSERAMQYIAPGVLPAEEAKKDE